MSASRRRTAVSYSRFSDPKQAAGDSAERQDRMYRTFCQRHNLTPGKEVFADRGRSGYDGTHREKGRLGQLIAAAKEPRFDPGTVIVIEAWDRLGRMRPDKQTALVAELLQTGVSIGICRLDDIFTEDDFGTHKWTTLAVFIQLAHQESKQKAERIAASWQQRRERARKNGSLVGSTLPAWIEVVNGEPRLIPERVDALRRIFELAGGGLGYNRILRALQDEKVPAFGRQIIRPQRSRSQFAGRWTRSYVYRLLRDRRVLGEFQLLKGNDPDGSPLVDYYPPAITQEQFSLAQASYEQRLNRDTLGRASGPRQTKHVNIFKSMLTHTRDGEGFVLHNKGTAKRPELLLIDTRGDSGRAKAYSFPYHLFEEKVLGLVKEINAADILKTKRAGSSTVEVLRAKIATCRHDIASLKQDLKTGYSKALSDVMREKEATDETLVNQLQDELAKIARPLERSWNELPSLIDLIKSADEPAAARLRVRAALRAVLESGTVLIVPFGSWRVLALQLNFIDGKARHFLLYYRPAVKHRPQVGDAGTFAEAGLPDNLDLRKPEHAKRLEKELLRALETRNSTTSEVA